MVVVECIVKLDVAAVKKCLIPNVVVPLMIYDNIYIYI